MSIATEGVSRKKTEQLRMGLIGVGGMGSGHCATITKDVGEAKLTAVCDIDLATGEAVGEKFGVPFFGFHGDLIKSGLCDAVIVATPHPSHAPVSIDCMNAGIHVLSEKPVSETIGNAEKMVRASRKNRVAFGVMFQRRFEPAFRKAIELVSAGGIGKIYRATLISPEYRSQAYYDSGTWRATWSGEGGGVMMNQGPHIMDIFVQLAGLPRSVLGFVDARLHNIEVEDIAEARLTFKGGGSGFFYCSTNEPGPGQMIEIFGDRGKLLYRDGRLSFRRFVTPIVEFTKINKDMWGWPPAEDVALDIPEQPTGHRDVIRNFARHILAGESLVCPGESALPSLELANAITLSSYTGKEVRLPVSRKAYDALLARLRRTSSFKKRKVAVKRITDPAHVR